MRGRRIVGKGLCKLAWLLWNSRQPPKLNTPDSTGLRHSVRSVSAATRAQTEYPGVDGIKTSGRWLCRRRSEELNTPGVDGFKAVK